MDSGTLQKAADEKKGFYGLYVIFCGCPARSPEISSTVSPSIFGGGRGGRGSECCAHCCLDPRPICFERLALDPAVEVAHSELSFVLCGGPIGFGRILFLFPSAFRLTSAAVRLLLIDRCVPIWYYYSSRGDHCSSCDVVTEREECSAYTLSGGGFLSPKSDQEHDKPTKPRNLTIKICYFLPPVDSGQTPYLPAAGFFLDSSEARVYFPTLESCTTRRAQLRPGEGLCCCACLRVRQILLQAHIT